jgi:hypothetical protein
VGDHLLGYDDRGLGRPSVAVVRIKHLGPVLPLLATGEHAVGYSSVARHPQKRSLALESAGYQEHE